MQRAHGCLRAQAVNIMPHPLGIEVREYQSAIVKCALQSNRDCVKNLFWFNDRYVLEDRKAGMDVVVEVRCLLRLVVLVVSCFPI